MTGQNNQHFLAQYSAVTRLIILSLALSIIFSSAPASAISKVPSQIFFHDKHAKLIAFASNKSQVRISFPPLSIKEVVGDTNKYKIIHDRLGMSVFILPKAAQGEEINLTIITTSGKTQDLLLKINDKEVSSSIIIYNKSSVQDGANKGQFKITNQDILEGKQLLKSMNTLKKSKYNVIHLNPNSSPKLSHNIGYIVDVYNQGRSELEIRESSIYEYKLLGLKGVILEIVNKGNNRVSISEEDISSLFNGVILSSIKDNTIFPKSRTRGYLVLKESTED